MKHSSERGAIEMLIVVTIVIGMIVVGFGRCATNVDGTSQREAEKGARAFAKELGVQISGLSCAGTDSDGDGYVSCTIAKTDGSLLAIECAGALTMNRGCRVPKLRAATEGSTW